MCIAGLDLRWEEILWLVLHVEANAAGLSHSPHHKIGTASVSAVPQFENARLLPLPVRPPLMTLT
jgi:hypothetical protein